MSEGTTKSSRVLAEYSQHIVENLQCQTLTRPVDPFGQHPVEQPASGPDEQPPGI